MATKDCEHHNGTAPRLLCTRGKSVKQRIATLLRFALLHSLPHSSAAATDRGSTACLTLSAAAAAKKRMEEEREERERGREGGREGRREVGRQIWGTLLPVRMWRRRLPATTVNGGF